MNLSALKTFAPAVRLQLMEAVTRKLDFVLTADTADLRAMSAQRERLRHESERDRKGLVERVAYTWFNRFTALRFLDAHGWHPFGARAITAATAEETLPELLSLVRSGQLPAELASHTDHGRLNRLLDGVLPSDNPQSEVYRHLVLAACRFYHTLLPNIFERLDDETELLLPDDLLTERSVVHGFRTEISDADCAEVEIIGWLYQFYISEKKDEVMARKSAVPTEDIPAVTQLFTPHWIVRYLVENSLGRLWLLNRPRSKLRAHMPYYIEGETEIDFLKITKAEDIRICDPAVGSGHILSYAFDLLTLIYEEEGYAPTDIPTLILRHNLHGLDICPRAAQLAELALVFKAREKSRRFFQPEHLVGPHIIELREVRFDENELLDYIRALGLGDLFNQPVLKLLHQFEEAKNFGSLIQPCLGESEISDLRLVTEVKDLGGQLFLRETHLKILRVLEQAKALTQRYHVVVANPPYMGRQSMNPNLSKFLEQEYPSGKSDLMTAFILRCLRLLEENAMFGCITLDSWMFLSSYVDLRVSMLKDYRVDSLVHVGWNCFPEGHIYNRGVAFIIANQNANEKEGRYIDLSSVAATVEKEGLLLDKIRLNQVFLGSSDMLKKIPGAPIAYWVSTKFAATFEQLPSSGSINQGRFGMSAADPSIILWWHEVSAKRIKFGAQSSTAFDDETPFAPYDKGGPFRRWYGNRSHVIDWRNDGEQTRDNPRAAVQNARFFCKPHISWTLVTSSVFSVRSFNGGFLLDTASNAIYDSPEIDPLYHLAVLNSVFAREAFKILNPTLNFSCGVVDLLPICCPQAQSVSIINQTTATLVAIARADWDNFETSWDFRDQPLLRPGLKGATLEASWRNWEAHSTAAIRRMQELETANNRLFIAAYGLDGELQPDVAEAQITLARAEAQHDMAAFLSYAVGCMMGRYAIDRPGLMLADPGDNLCEFLTKVGLSQTQLTFAPDEDGIIPVLDGEWFEDDIVARTRDFLRANFGEATLNENLCFIEESLGKGLRKYFQTDFYKNHISSERAYGYKKRPIYWMFRSPKGGFAALVYLHRMTRDTPNLILNRYLRDYLQKLRARIEHLDHAQLTAATARDKTAARKESDQLKKNLRECEEWEREVLLPLAQSRPALDLDDGVKVNYLKLGEALAPIAGLAAKEED